VTEDGVTITAMQPLKKDVKCERKKKTPASFQKDTQQHDL
jgi:hypothetical protein